MRRRKTMSYDENAAHEFARRTYPPNDWEHEELIDDDDLDCCPHGKGPDESCPFCDEAVEEDEDETDR
jgi:hypothetical protein